ncbi:hypothetical protein Tco_0660401 [Tanacetum coccineum]
MSLSYHEATIAEAEKEKEIVKAKVEKWHNSFKNLSLLQNSQMSANDKFGLGYGDHRYDGILSYENEVLQSVFMNKESDLENQPLYNRFVTAEGMHTYTAKICLVWDSQVASELVRTQSKKGTTARYYNPIVQSNSMAGSQDDIPPPPPPPSQTPTQQTPHNTILSGKLYKLEMDLYQSPQIRKVKSRFYRTAEEISARERERKARTTFLMALPEDHLAKFHKMTDAKEMWNAIKSRFGRNDESKKMQKYILKQQFEGFSLSNSEGLHKGYDRFQSLLIQLEIHGIGVSTEDANQKFLRSLPSAWSQNDVKGSTASSSSTQNVAFVSKNTSSTNDVSTAYGVSNPSVQNSQYEHASSYSLLANQSSCPQFDHEDLEQLDEFDLEEMDCEMSCP